MKNQRWDGGSFSVCIGTRTFQNKPYLTVQAILVAVDFCRSLCVIVGGSLFSTSRKKGLTFFEIWFLFLIYHYST